MSSRDTDRIAADDLYRFELITDVRISPNGRFIAYTVQRVDKKTEKKYSNIWLAATDGSHVRQFTVGDHVDGSPRWSPDSSQIAFTSNRKDEKQPQLYLIPVDGGEARPLTDLKGNFGVFSWSPDGSKLLLSFRKKDKEAIEREEDDQKKKLGVVARRITTTRFKYDGAGYLPQEKWHIWTVDVSDGSAAQLTDGDHDELNPVWSPDGQQIAFNSNRSDDPDLTPDRDAIYVMPAAGGEMRQIEAPIGPKYLPTFSPDGNTIAYLGSEGEGLWFKNSELWLAPADGSAAAYCASADFDLHLVGGSGSDVGGGNMMLPTWSPDGSKVYVQATVQGDVALMAVDLHDDKPAIRRIVDQPGVVGAFSFDDDGDTLAYMLNAQDLPVQLFVHEMEGGETRQLTHLNTKWFGDLKLGQVEEVWFTARDGYRLHGWILTPPDFDPEQTYPTIVEIHGGPMTQYDRGFMHEFRLLAANGYVVAWSNPRGGQGYGEEHCKAIWNAWGTVDFDDVMDWAAYVRDLPYVDTARMGVTGGSYGGYMTNMIIGRAPDFFKAAVTQRSVSNLISMWGSSDGNWMFQQTVADNLPPFRHLDKYWAGSPMKYIGGAKTPTLVIHSEQDLRVAQEQGEQVFVALRTQGVETELVIFPDEPHGLSRNGRTDRRVERLNHILRWFDKYLQ